MGGEVKAIIPHLVINGAAEAIGFYARAFGAIETYRMPARDGKKLWHAGLLIGGLPVYLCDEFPEAGGKSPLTLGGTPVTLHVQVDDADAVFDRAVGAGATVLMPLDDMFWGDRFGKLKDPFGHEWTVAATIE